MSPKTSIRYLVDSKRGVIWTSVDNEPWVQESNINDAPTKYFQTLKGIYYMRQYPESAIKLLSAYENGEDNRFFD